MDQQLRNIILIITASLLVLAGIFWFLSMGSNNPVDISGNRVEGQLTLAQLSEKTGCVAPESGSLDDFAKCIADKGAKFFGAFWCPHCEDQKKLFGDSAQYLPYVECSTPDGKGQLEVCSSQNVKVYPTWEFAQ